ncbi:MAG: LicD family protein [Selenomonadaceae bacterium]|nr:LicD family protein [Selenomonadaceae bacterium]
MSFIRDLYRDEIRDGWLVTADTKKIWNRQLEIWSELDRICRKHDITYWAGWGTLLGAARHNGFIP